MGMNNISAFETGYRFFQVLTQYQLEFRILSIGLKKGILAKTLVYIVRLCRKILDGNQAPDSDA